MAAKNESQETKSILGKNLAPGPKSVISAISVWYSWFICSENLSSTLSRSCDTSCQKV